MGGRRCMARAAPSSATDDIRSCAHTYSAQVSKECGSALFPHAWQSTRSSMPTEKMDLTNEPPEVVAAAEPAAAAVGPSAPPSATTVECRPAQRWRAAGRRGGEGRRLGSEPRAAGWLRVRAAAVACPAGARRGRELRKLTCEDRLVHLRGILLLAEGEARVEHRDGHLQHLGRDRLALRLVVERLEDLRHRAEDAAGRAGRAAVRRALLKEGGAERVDAPEHLDDHVDEARVRSCGRRARGERRGAGRAGRRRGSRRVEMRGDVLSPYEYWHGESARLGTRWQASKAQAQAARLARDCAPARLSSEPTSGMKATSSPALSPPPGG